MEVRTTLGTANVIGLILARGRIFLMWGIQLSDYSLKCNRNIQGFTQKQAIWLIIYQSPTIKTHNLNHILKPGSYPFRFLAVRSLGGKLYIVLAYEVFRKSFKHWKMLAVCKRLVKDNWHFFNVANVCGAKWAGFSDNFYKEFPQVW